MEGKCNQVHLKSKLNAAFLRIIHIMQWKKTMIWSEMSLNRKTIFSTHFTQSTEIYF